MFRANGLFLAAALLQAAPGWAQDSGRADILTDVIVVSGLRMGDDIVVDAMRTPDSVVLPADASGVAARVAGGALVGNGALAGQLSYRGLSGERVLGRVNGQRFASGGPNAMDPPLHYAPSVLVERIEVARGVAPVSDGPALAGAVNAVLRQPGFSDGADVRASGFASVQARSVDESLAIGGVAGLSTDSWRIGVIGSRERGQDYAFAGGTAVGTRFARDLYGVQAGLRAAGGGAFFLEYRRSETGPSGNPPFALDTVYFHTDFLQGGYEGDLAERVRLDLRLGRVAVRHLMDNQTLRQPPAPSMTARETFADADTATGEMKLRFGDERRNVSVGGDGQIVDKTVRIGNPFNPAFFIESQPAVRETRFGGFVQWRGAAEPLALDLGVRVDRTAQSAGTPALGTAVPAGPRLLAAAFAATPRARADTTADIVLRAWAPLGDMTPRLTLARKTRVPSVLERFGWLPTEASYGLADGNIYVGNPDLRPEVAWIAEAGFDYEAGGLMLRPTVFYRRVDDYVQGTPFDDTPGLINSPVETVAAMSGDATPLRFSNVDAALYGVDLDFRSRLTGTLMVEGTASLVHAARRDVDDALYRVAPANLRLAAIWARNNLAFGAEMVAAAAQKRVSVVNSETASPGYVVFSAFGKVQIMERLALEAGVENLFDRFYAPHLSGLNRVGASDVAPGQRLPGAGRGVWVRASVGF